MNLSKSILVAGCLFAIGASTAFAEENAKTEKVDYADNEVSVQINGNVGGNVNVNADDASKPEAPKAEPKAKAKGKAKGKEAKKEAKINDVIIVTGGAIPAPSLYAPVVKQVIAK